MSFTQRDLLVAFVAACLGYLIGRSRSANVPRTGPGPATIAPRLPAVAADWNEPGNWSVQILDAGNRKINVIRSIRLMTRCGLKESKDLAESAPPVTVLQGVSEAMAKRAVAELEEAGAKVAMGQRRGGAV